MSFFRMLQNAVAEKDSLLCIGLDPSFSEQRIRELGVEQCAEEALAHNLRLIEATAPYAAAFKPNSAFYEALGEPGMQALHATIAAIPDTIPVILDAKRGDISSTGAAYAQAVFGRIGADAVTLSPYMGIDTLDPFLSWEGKGIFLLCRTSNPGADFLQD
ncbi:MAG: orotidine-5'-phosphate decarboxylase, partial [Spirochaetales bacterium]|nr:orotidine-5'-phosphate decarboxylase [Spirochaetales bacterium]